MNSAHIQEIGAGDTNRWNETVRSVEGYDVFYLNEYARAFQMENEENGEPLLLYYENGTDNAVSVVFRRDVGLEKKLKGKAGTGKYYDLVSPYGYGGFTGTISDYTMLNSAYDEYCTVNGYVCEFVRFHLFGEYRKNYNGFTASRTHNIVRSLDLSVDELWMDFRPKVRKNVKRANSYNLELVVDTDGKYLDDFLRIYYSTMDRTDAKEEFFFSRRFFECINRMKENYAYFHVKSGEKIISTELVIYGPENAYSYLGGTDREYFGMRPNDFLKFEIIKWCREKGLKTFVLGGGYGTDDGIYSYKKCLAPDGVVEFFIGHKIFNPEVYGQLVGLRAEDNPECRETEYFPQYRC